VNEIPNQPVSGALKERVLGVVVLVLAVEGGQIERAELEAPQGERGVGQGGRPDDVAVVTPQAQFGAADFDPGGLEVTGDGDRTLGATSAKSVA
jgi:hypothetical protein